MLFCNWSDLLYSKVHLSELAQKFMNFPITLNGFLWQKSHFQEAKQLRNNTDIYLTRPDRGAGAVLLNCSNYVSKLSTILDDVSKFHMFGDLSFDDSLKMEVKLQKWFLQLHKCKLLTKEIYERIRLVGSQQPRMYRLPKIHKLNVPLRPVLIKFVCTNNLFKYI